MNATKPVVVLPVPRERAVVSQSQAKAARTPETHHNGHGAGVLRPQMKGGSVGLGIPSTVRTVAHLSPIKPTRSGVPGTRRRGHSHKPANMAFAAPIPSDNHYSALARAQREQTNRQRFIDAQRELAFMKKWHAALLAKLGHINAFYARSRYHALRVFPEIGQELARIETAHRRSMIK